MNRIVSPDFTMSQYRQELVYFLSKVISLQVIMGEREKIAMFFLFDDREPNTTTENVAEQ